LNTHGQAPGVDRKALIELDAIPERFITTTKVQRQKESRHERSRTGPTDCYGPTQASQCKTVRTKALPSRAKTFPHPPRKILCLTRIAIHILAK
jgi:hypothetical protein